MVHYNRDVREIRECREADFDKIVLLLKQLWPSKELEPTLLRSVYMRGLTSDAQEYFCVVEGGNVVGFCSLTIKNNLWEAGYLAHIDELIVDEKHQGQGIGTELMTRISREAAERGCSRIELDSAFNRKDAHKFHAAHGFENRAYLFSKVLSQDETPEIWLVAPDL